MKFELRSHELGVAFQKWIEHKQATDPFWSGPYAAERVIFSGPDVPGEGEHKVMDYIRRASGAHRARGNAMIGVLDALLFEYGHTLGHAVEGFMATLYRKAREANIPYEEAIRDHGQCVGMGVLWAAALRGDPAHSDDRAQAAGRLRQGSGGEIGPCLLQIFL